MRAATLLLLVGFASSPIIACGARTSEPPPAPPPRTETGLPSATPSEPPPVSSSAPPSEPAKPDDAKPKLCGCSLCEPLVSDDACAADSDCAPSAACHADRCIAKAKAPKRDPHQMCTMMMACHSVDANRCGCHKGKCALIPK